MARASVNAIAVTYRDPNGRRENEVRCAGKLSQAIGIEWHCIDLPAPTDEKYEEIAWLKDGMNWTSMSYILGYMEEIIRRWDRRWTYISGDGGDDCLKVTAPRRRFPQTGDLVEYIFDKEVWVSPCHAETVMKLPRGTLREELQQLFDSYPERDLARRIKHFKIYERGRRCFFEGEDRSRFFLWQDSPFYSLPLWRHCMRVPDRQKEAKVFCRRALMALSPEAAGVPVVDSSGYAPSSLRYVLYHRAKEIALNLPGPLLKMVRFCAGSVVQPHYVVPDHFMAYLHEQSAQKSPLCNLINIEEALRSVHNTNFEAFFCLWTVVMLEKAYRSRIG